MTKPDPITVIVVVHEGGGWHVRSKPNGVRLVVVEVTKRGAESSVSWPASRLIDPSHPAHYKEG